MKYNLRLCLIKCLFKRIKITDISDNRLYIALDICNLKK